MCSQNVYKNQEIAHQNICVVSSPDPNGSSVQLQLTFKFPPAKRDSMKTEIEAILHQILKDNMAFWNAVPTSMRLIGISLISIIFYYLAFWTTWGKKVLGKK